MKLQLGLVAVKSLAGCTKANSHDAPVQAGMPLCLPVLSFACFLLYRCIVRGKASAMQLHSLCAYLCTRHPKLAITFSAESVWSGPPAQR